jgi:hypothetical protein
VQKLGAEVKCKKVEREAQETIEFFPWYREVDASPYSTLEHSLSVLLPLKSPRLKCSLRVPVLHLRNGGSRTVYTKLFLRLPQSPRAHEDPPKHQDRLGAIKLRE